MSFNQSRAEKSEAQLRKPGGRFGSGPQRNYPGGGRGGGGIGAGTASSIPSSSSYSGNRSFKKSVNNGQGGQSSRTGSISLNSESNVVITANRVMQDGAHVQSQSHDVPTSKPIEMSGQKISRAVPKAPSSQPATSGGADVPAPGTPSKGEASRSFTLQFGSISPGFMNGMQIPARTSSAPPNLDEQKRDQMRHDSSRPTPTVPVPSAAPKPQPLKKDVGHISQPNLVVSHPPPQAKREVQMQVSTAPIATTNQKTPSAPITGMSLPMPYQQPPVSLQFGNPTAQMQSQGVAASSMQMQMALPVGNATQMPQQVFVPGLQSIPLPHQGMIHQGQSLGYAPQMGHQLGHQLGNLGIGVPPQYNSQQGGKFGGVGPRKTVKITHPETHEELKFDKGTETYSDIGSSGARNHPSVPPQSQPIQSYSPAPPMNYFPPIPPNSYNPSMFFQNPTSLPLSSAQMTPASTAQRYNYPVGQGGPPISFINPPVLNTLPGNKAGTPMLITEPPNSSASAPSASVRVTVKPAVKPVAEKFSTSGAVSLAVTKGEATTLKQSVEASLPNQKPENNKQPKSVVESADSVPLPVTVKHPTQTSASVSTHGQTSSTSSVPVTPSDESVAVAGSEDQKKEPLRRSDSLKDQWRKPSRKELQVPQQQHQADSADSLKSPLLKIPGDGNSDIGGQASNNGQGVQISLERVGESLNVSNVPAALKSNICSQGEEVKAASLSENSETTLESSSRALQSAHASGSDASTTLADGVKDEEGQPCESSNPIGLESEGNASIDRLVLANKAISNAEDVLKGETTDAEEQSKLKALDGSLSDGSNLGVSVSADIGDQTNEVFQPVVKPEVVEKLNDASECNGKESKCIGAEVGTNPEDGKTLDSSASSFATSSSLIDGASASLKHKPVTDATEEDASLTVKSKVDCEKSKSVEGVVVTESVNRRLSIASSSVLSEMTRKSEGKGEESTSGSETSFSSLGSKDKIPMEQNRPKSASGKRKKKRDICMKADAAGTNFDMYGAYKAPEDKHETSESLDSSVDVEHAHVDGTEKETVVSEEDVLSKSELDDWEDAVEIPTPELKTSENGNSAHGSSKRDDDYGAGVMGKKKYTRDFLFTFQEHKDLPADFEIGSDIVDALMSGPVASSYLIDRDSHTNSARIVDRPTGGPRLDRRGSAVDDDKWGKAPGVFAMVRDPRMDVMPGGGVTGNFRPGQTGNFGVLRNPRGQPSGPPVGGILLGPMQGMLSPGGMIRNSPDVADRWHRAKGLIPSPQTPLQVMHKAEKKYEVGKVSDQEETKQRRLKGILNKLTPQNFDKLFEQVKEVNIDSVVTLTGVISQIFDKALMEPTFCEMYADFCFHLAGALPDFNEDNEKITFKRVLLNKCQEEFERGEKEQAEANRDEEEGEVKQSAEEREEKRIKARRRMLGNIRLIGELYKKKMLTERIMHECIQKLLGQNQTPDEEDVEALCKLMSTIGEMIDHPKAKEYMDTYFEMMRKLSNNQKLSSRVRFMLRDAIDLRKNKWQQRRKVEGPKKIEEVHRDAAQERQLQTNRLSRAGSSLSSTRRGPPIDYSPRGPMTFSPNAQQMSGPRSLPPQMRGFGVQDVRLEDRHVHDGRMLSVPLPQRPIDDDSITLGPQGGLGRGMSIRGQPLMPSVPLVDVSSSFGESRRMPVGPNGYSTASDYPSYNSRGESMPRYMSERFMAPPAYDQSSSLERNTSFGMSMDRGFDRSVTSTPPATLRAPVGAQNAPLESKMPEEKLRSLSISAIREFYSARNEDEVLLCVKDLNSPSFYPDMVTLWVTDSFERKNDTDRDLLAKLLVNLCKSQEGLISQAQILKGFEGVLSMLEDAVTDSPKAAEYLGRILGKVVSENVVPLRDIGRLIHDGGEEPGSLIETGLASDVLVTILEIVKRDRGDAVLSEMRISSNLRLEDFRHRDPVKLRRLEAFM